MQLKIHLFILFLQIVGSVAPETGYEGDGLRETDENEIPFEPLAQYNDYVDKDIMFFHKDVKVSWNMKFTSEWQKVEANRKESDATGMTLYTYFPKDGIVTQHDHDLMTALESRYQEWAKNLQLGNKFLFFATKCSRLFTIFNMEKGLSIDQLSFAHIHFTSTFILDDPYEASCRLQVLDTFGAKYIENLRNIIYGRHGQLVNLLELLPRDATDTHEKVEILNAVVHDAEIAQKALKSTIEMAQNIFSLAHFKLHQKFCNTWLTYLVMEAPNFQYFSNLKEYPAYSVLQSTRRYTVGFELVLAGVIPATRDEYLTFFDYEDADTGNPGTMLGSIVVAIDNDIVGIPKETNDKEFSPSNFAMTLKKATDKSSEAILNGVREALRRRNNMLKEMEDTFATLQEKQKEAYENLLKYVVSIGEFEYIVGEGIPNHRYKWGCKKV